MPFFPDHSTISRPWHRYRAGFAALLGVFSLTACDSLDMGNAVDTLNPFAEVISYPCPEALILADAASITSFRPGSPKDLLDVRYRAYFEIEDYKCDWNLDSETAAGILTMEFTPVAVATPGPALDGDQISVPYFITVTDQDRNILTKSQFDLASPLPHNASKVRLRDRQITVEMPVSGGQRDDDFVLFTGFQVTPDQLDYNRAQRQKQRR